MTMNITRWDTGAIIYTGEAATIAELLTNAVNDHIDCYRANLVGANLDGANLVGANLLGANLVVANLVGANLDGANLVVANLVGANLVGANLVGANLLGANLLGANLLGALIGDHICAGPFMQLTGVAEWGTMVAYTAKNSGLRVMVGCRHFSIDEARTHWAERGDRVKTRLALSMVEVWFAGVGL
jgi:uncharacterized protein YjbI with pentapeptide repeats